MRTSLTARALTAVVAASALLVGAGIDQASATDPTPVLAQFEGETIDLSQGWGDATACDVADAGVNCYRTEAELDAALGQAVAARGADFVVLGTCGSSLRLYADTGHGGSVLNLSTTGTWLSLSGYGFDNTTSSYTVGSCASTFTSSSGGAGTVYPGATGAGASASSMLSGWDNNVSSVRIS